MLMFYIFPQTHDEKSVENLSGKDRQTDQRKVIVPPGETGRGLKMLSYQQRKYLS